MPPGFVIDQKTGVISGRFTQAGKWAWQVTAINMHGTAHADLQVEVVERKVVDTEIAKEICRCMDREMLMALEPDRNESLVNWMIWMVHRVYLNDPTLTELNFTNLVMPPPKAEPLGELVVTKLMQSLVTNTHLEKLILTGSKLRPHSIPMLAGALRKNYTLIVLHVDSNLLNVDNIQEIAEALAENKSRIEEWRFANQAGIGTKGLGDATEESLAIMMKSNERLVRFLPRCNNEDHRKSIDKYIMRNINAAGNRRGASKVLPKNFRKA